MATRKNQKDRTRTALLEAARALMAEGSTVTLAKVAERAGTSRATVYRYFSDPGVLAADATLDIEVIPNSELLAGLTDVRDRVHAVALYFLNFSRSQETLFRQFLAKSLLVSIKKNSVKMRGARRVIAFDEALKPVRPTLDAADYSDLVYRLTMTTGMETLIVLEDVLEVDVAKGNDLQMGMVDALLDAYLPQPG